jgi:hypothetical protein
MFTPNQVRRSGTSLDNRCAPCSNEFLFQAKEDEQSLVATKQSVT